MALGNSEPLPAGPKWLVKSNSIGWRPCLVFDVGADDDPESVAEGLDAAVAVAEVVVEDARDEVAVLELDLAATLELAAAVLASLEPEITK